MECGHVRGGYTPFISPQYIFPDYEAELHVVVQGVYTPSIISTSAIQMYKGQVGNMSSAMYSGLNTTLYSYREAAYAGELTRLTPQEWATLNATIATAARANRNLTDPKVSQTGMSFICF